MEPKSSMEQQFLKKFIEIIDANLHDEKFGVSELAAELGMSRFTLHRKVKTIINKSVSEFIRDARLKRAFDLLQQKTGNVSEIAYEVGFGSVSYFNRCFSEQYGYPPGEVLKGLHTVPENNRNKSKKTFFQKVKASKILYILPIIILLAIAGYHFFPDLNSKTIEKTIAVLPFLDYSPVEGQRYFVDGVRVEILSKLGIIEDIDVVSRTTSDNFANSGKSVKQIGKELKASYIVEGSGQIINNDIHIQISLISIKTDKTIWSKSYTAENNVESLSEMQENVAISVASKIKANITPAEKRQLARRITNNDAAYNSYLQGLNYLKINNVLEPKADLVIIARKFFENAISLDPTFAEAYCQLAYVFIHQLPFIYNNEFNGLYNSYLDSGLVLANKALEFGVTNANLVYQLKADYYQRNGMQEEAMENFEKIWEHKAKDYTYYLFKVNYNHWNHYNSETIKNFFLYLKLKPDTVLLDQNILFKMVYCFSATGFPKTAKIFADELYRQTNDSVQHLISLGVIDFYDFKFGEHIDKIIKVFHLDTTNISHARSIRFTYYHMREIDSAFFWTQKIEQIATNTNQEITPNIVIGNLYLLKGFKVEGDRNINGALDICNEELNSNNRFAQNKYAYGLLSGIYSVKGEKRKALHFLKLMEEEKKIVGRLVIKQLEVMPMYDNIRNEPEFTEVLNQLKAKYQKDHERARKIIISNGMEPE